MTAAPTLEPDVLTTFATFFPPNPCKHGRHIGTTAQGKKQVSTQEGQPVTPDMLRRHLGIDGKMTAYGLGYLPGFANETNVGLIDLDAKDHPGEKMEAAKAAVLEAARELGLAVYSERSTSGKGWHIWLWSDTPLPYGVMRDALKCLIRRANLKDTTETYPMGAVAASRWVLIPYHGAMKPNGDRLGKTWLETPEGERIPVDELEEWIKPNPAETLHDLAKTLKDTAPSKAPKITAPALSAEGDLAPEAVPLLLEVALQKPPDARHDALAAFLNLGQRAGDLAAMAEGLKDPDVLSLWCPDGSRTPEEWAAEVDRWTENVREGKTDRARGLPYLKAEGYSVPSLPKSGHPAPGQNPVIATNERHLREVAADAERALIGANEPPVIFKRGGVLVRLESAQRLVSLDAVALKGRLDRVADFMIVTEVVEKDEDGKKQMVTAYKATRPPADLAPDLLARVDQLPLPPLHTLATSPVFSAAGELIHEPGYHAASGIYLVPGALEGVRADMPREVALGLLGELLQDFPFAPYDAGFAHTLAGLLLPFVRAMINGPTPLHLIEAPTRGTGKGLLSEVIAHVTLGHAAGVMVQPRDGDEFEKRVTSTLLEGARVILLDNVHTLKGEALAAILTARIWRGRLLGQSKMLTLPNDALWLATGNNVALDDDMPRRIVPIRLDPGVERPEERTGFRHPDLLGWVKENRSALVSACLSLVMAWIDAGRPAGTGKLGSYESWTATIGGILDVAGVPGFLSARDALYETANSEPQEWAAVLADLHKQHGAESIGAREFCAAMQRLDACPDYWEGKSRASALRRVGRAVTQRRDRVFGGHRIRPAGKTATGNAAYRVEAVEARRKKTPETQETPEQGQPTSPSTAFPESTSSSETPGVCPVFLETLRQTPEKHRNENSVSEGLEGVSGVSGVFSEDQPDAVEL